MSTLAVILPTYNSAEFLSECIGSILDQTFRDFHLYVFDDGSTDSTKDLVQSYRDDRIFYRRNEINEGIAATLNTAFLELKHKYPFLARMDADDWCFPERFKRQLEELRRQKDLIMCGTQGYWCQNLENVPLQTWTYPLQHDHICLNLLFSASFGHSSVIFKSSFLIEHDLKYDTYFSTCEDWELWTRIVTKGKVANLPDFLMKYRILNTSNHRHPEKKDIHLWERCTVISKQWKNLGYDVDKRDIFDFMYGRGNRNSKDLNRILQLFISLYNDLCGRYIRKLDKPAQVAVQNTLSRNIARFRKNSQQPLYSITFWQNISKVRFTNKILLIKNLVR